MIGMAIQLTVLLIPSPHKQDRIIVSGNEFPRITPRNTSVKPKITANIISPIKALSFTFSSLSRFLAITASVNVATIAAALENHYLSNPCAAPN